MCGIIGIVAENPVIGDLYDGLSTLQHRGQDAAGIFTYDGKQVHERKGRGLVRDVITSQDVRKLKGNLGIGHVRYPTAGSYSEAESQPFYVNSPFGLALVHNGNLTNPETLRKELNSKEIRHLNTKSDSEILLNVLADEISRQQMKRFSAEKLFSAVSKTMKRVNGSYAAVVLIAGQGLLAFRDPEGLRPLCIGKRKGKTQDEYTVASENVALAVLGYEMLGDIQAGEAVWITQAGKITRKQCAHPNWAPCIFEYVYLARPDATIDNVSVYKARLRSGEFLAAQIRKANLPIDVVIPVPDTSRAAALTVASSLGVRFREGLIKNRYIGRTFIMPTQAKRNKSIRHKLTPIELEIRKKNVLLVDDSIVRGNTSRQLVEMVRAAGAKKVYLAAASPALKFPCVYGVDMPSKKEFIANGLTTDEICKQLKADALFYLPLPDLVESCQYAKSRHRKKFCTACFDGKYPTKEVTPKYLAEVEKAREDSRGIGEDPTQLTLL